MNKQYTLIFILVIVFFSAHGFAEEVNFGEGNEPTVDAVVDALKPDDYSNLQLRGINYKPAEPKMVSLTLEFEKNSYELTEQTKTSLSMIAKALNSDDLKDLNFTLEGHADASGTDAYNLDLSKKRAAAVKQYLVGSQSVNPESLGVVGKGESELLDKENPTAKKNRRVRIVTNQ